MHMDQAPTENAPADVDKTFLLFLVAGFSLTWSVTYVFAYSFVFTPLDAFTQVQADTARVAYIGGIALMQGVLCLFVSRLLKHEFRLPMALVLSLLLCVMVALYTFTFQRQVGTWVIVPLLISAGLWQGGFHVLWAEQFVYLGETISRRLIFLSVGVGAVVFIVTVLIAQEATTYLTILLGICSLGCYIAVQARQPKVELSKKVGSRKLKKSFHKSNVTMMVFGAVFGVGIYAAMTTTALPTYIAYALTGAALALGAFALLIISLVSNRSYTLNEITLALSPVIAILLLTLVFVTGLPAWIIYIGMLALLTSFDTTAFCFHLAVTREMGLAPFSALSRGRFFIQFGMFIASLANLVFVYYVDASHSHSFLIPLVMVGFLFVMMSTVSRVDFMPHESADEPHEKEPELVMGEQQPAAQPVTTADLVQAMGNDYDLSRRERDVLNLLLGGHTAQSIADKLVISLNTVKSHTYHIYRKMGINSKQEIVDIRDAYVKKLQS